MYLIRETKQYHKSFKRLKKSGNFPEEELNFVVNTLARGEILSLKYQDHALKGEYFGYRECHVKPDLLLVYQIKSNLLILVLADIGSHSEIFG